MQRALSEGAFGRGLGFNPVALNTTDLFDRPSSLKSGHIKRHWQGMTGLRRAILPGGTHCRQAKLPK